MDFVKVRRQGKGSYLAPRRKIHKGWSVGRHNADDRKPAILRIASVSKEKMKRIGNLTPVIETPDNFLRAEEGYAHDKRSRRKVKKFEQDLDGNLSSMLMTLKNGTWKTSEYHDKFVVENGKQRKLCIYPMPEHVMEWAHTLHIEKPLTDTYVRSSCSCVQGRGQNDFIRLVYHDLYTDYEGTHYFVQLDAHHFFPNIDHNIMEQRLARKIKDKKVLAFLYGTIEHYCNGIVLGTKLSQIEGNFYLVPFDYLAMSLFGIMDDRDKYAYWCNRYVSDCIVTCRTSQQADELNKGVAYLVGKFNRLCREWIAKRHYYRFADNMLFLCSDKTFLHLIVEMATVELWNIGRVVINSSWNVRPVEPDGIDICGYVLFHDHIAERKRDKQKLCRQVARLRKRGLSPEQIRRACASRLGWAIHADARTMIKKLNVNMEYVRLGKSIVKGRHFIPFSGMVYEQKESITDLLCYNANDELRNMILLEDFLVTQSKAKADDTTLWIKYKRIDKTIPKVDKKGKPLLDENNEQRIDYIFFPDEHYCCSSSKTLIDQAQNDIDKTLLPQPTSIYVMTGKRGHTRYYKFT